MGVEYATMFSALDVPVTLIEPRKTILEFVDRELVDDFIHQMRDRGMTIRLGCAVKDIAVKENGVELTIADGRVVRGEILLYAAGRSGNVASLGLATVGIEADGRGKIKVDPITFRPSVPHIYAAGDVIGFPSLASFHGTGPGCRLPAFSIALPPPPEAFPYGIYAVPEISTVGQSEEQVQASGAAYECGVARFRETSRGHIMGVNSGFLKLIFALDTRRLLGAHIVGEGATELVHIGQAVINLKGTVDFYITTPQLSPPSGPTKYRALMRGTGWGRSNSKTSSACLAAEIRRREFDCDIYTARYVARLALLAISPRKQS